MNAHDLQFTQLPPELLTSIFELLDSRDIARCRQVCHLFRTVIDCSSSVQYQLELKSSFLIENVDIEDAAELSSPHIHSRSDLLSSLRRFNWSWKNMSWNKRYQRVPIENYAAVYELSGGYFVQDLNPSWTASDRPSRLSWMKLPSSFDDNATPAYEMQRTTKEFAFRVTDLCMDVERDLLVVIEKSDRPLFDPVNDVESFSISGRLHILCLSTQKPHPSADHPYLEFEFESQTRDQTLVIQLGGDHVGMLFSIRHLDIRSPDRLCIWNWTTGLSITNIASDDNCAWNSFCFLSEDAILLPDVHGHSLDIYVFGCTTSPPESQNLPSPSFYLAASLGLPTTRPNCISTHIGVRTEPPISSIRHSNHSYSKSKKRFSVDPLNAIVVITLDYYVAPTNPPYEENDYRHLVFNLAQPQTMITFRSSLLAHARRCSTAVPPGYAFQSPTYATSPSDSESDESLPFGIASATGKLVMTFNEPEIIPWEDWGRKETRLGLGPAPPRWVCYVYGTRFISMKDRGRMWIGEDRDGDDLEEDWIGRGRSQRAGVTLYDFNVMNARRKMRRPKMRSGSEDVPMDDDGDSDVREEEYVDATTELEHSDDGEEEDERDRPPHIVHAHNVLTESVNVIPEIFQAPVITGLPYRVLETEDMFDWDSVMIDGERIIGLKEDMEGIGLESLDVLVM